MNRLILLLLLLFSFATSYSQDSLVYFNEISFASATEKEAIKSFYKKESMDYFTLFNQIGKHSLPASKDQFYRFLNNLGYEKLADKKADKRVKFLYESIHKSFLSKYVTTATFSDIFNGGEYNCVAATALYSLAFEHFKIPFSIKEKPTHVYPVAYHESQQVIVETTNPLVGSFSFDQRYKLTYLENLKQQKLISVAEFSQTDVNKLFDKYFFTEQQDINLTQLVGIQYMNEGIFAFEANDMTKSYQQMEKAYLFYPSERISNSLLIAYLNSFKTHQSKDNVHATLLAKISRFKNSEITSEMVQADFYRAIEELLFTKGKVDDCQKYCSTVLNAVKDSVLRRDLDFVFNYEFGRYNYNKGSYVLARPYFEKALAIQPNHQETQSIYIGLLERSLKTVSDNNETIDLINSALKNHPELQSNNNFNSLAAFSYLYEFTMSYQENNATQGEKFKGLFEALVSAHPDLNLNQSAIGQAYSTAAVYYFRKNQNSKAKEYINKGLRYAPNNRELLQRQKMIP